MPPKPVLDFPPDEAIIEGVRRLGKRARLAAELGFEPSTLNAHIRRRGIADRCDDAAREHAHGSSASATGYVAVDHEAGEATIVGPPLDPAVKGDVDELIRENGLDPADWIVVSTTLNRWNALGKADESGENPVKTLRQLKVQLRLRPERIFPAYAQHIPDLVKPKPVRVSVDEPDLILIEGDHQAPFQDPRLDALMTQVTAEMRPTEQIFDGDLMDFATISRFADHPATTHATPNLCIQEGYGILRRRADASPDTRRRKVLGNHDWRPEQEILTRSERLYGLSSADEGDGVREPLWSLERALHLDRLRVELVQDPRGWQHAEIVLVPGPRGLVVRHGWVTGSNTAEKTLDKRGTSILFGHIHTRKDVRKWNPSLGFEQQATSVAAMCLVRDLRFPHFAVCDDWLQGAAAVTRWRDGRWRIEHMEYSDGVLTWRDRRWEAE